MNTSLTNFFCRLHHLPCEHLQFVHISSEPQQRYAVAETKEESEQKTTSKEGQERSNKHN